VNLLSIHPFLALILKNLNTTNKHRKPEQSGYKSVTKSSFNESTCVLGGNYLLQYHESCLLCDPQNIY